VVSARSESLGASDTLDVSWRRSKTIDSLRKESSLSGGLPRQPFSPSSMRFRPIGEIKKFSCEATYSYPDKGMANKKENEGFIRAAKDITAGSVGGIAQVLTGQPFDIVKVYDPSQAKRGG